MLFCQKEHLSIRCRSALTSLEAFCKYFDEEEEDEDKDEEEEEDEEEDGDWA